jgi:hypothetical protein
MIIKTVKWNKKLCVAILLALGVILVAIVLLSGLQSRAKEPGNKAAKSNAERVAYLAELGWEVKAEPVEQREIVIPQEFSVVFENYNELQKQQGFDLKRFAGKSAMLYSYEVTNYPSSDIVLADLYIINNRVVAGDIHSTALDGFMHTLTANKK